MNAREFIAVRIRDLRNERGLSQAGFARLFKEPVSKQTISSWETARTVPGPEEVLEICRIFGVSPDSLYPPTATEYAVVDTDYSRYLFERAMADFLALNNEGRELAARIMQDLKIETLVR